MSVCFVVVQRVSCFGEKTTRHLRKTTRRFVKSDLSFYEKQAVVLWKVENGREGIGKR